MIISSSYKTVENNGLLAHIYEHLLAQYVMKALQGRGFFISSDIILTAKTYGDTCFMDVEFYSPEAQDAYNEALRLFDKWDIPRSAALRVATECGIEIVDYCLEKLEGKANRRAQYTTCLVINFPDGREEVIFGENSGVILTESREESRLKGMPFRELFFVPELNMMFHEVRELPKLKRNGYSLGHEVAVEKCANVVRENLSDSV
ncbi:hypothetical protein EUA70_00760 [TM7 phylum sp. oral taxon 352]|nr:hypothetical protein EUA70_00760 [TM7 phylum sp. oral taxon 352]